LHPFVFLEPENKLLSGSSDGTIRIWNLDTFTQEYSLEFGLGGVICGYRIPGTSRVAIGSGNSYDIMILDINSR
jgi:WD40 repeat protein